MRNLIFKGNGSVSGWDKKRIKDAALADNRRKKESSFPYPAFSKYNLNSIREATINADIYDALLIYTGKTTDKGGVGKVNNDVSIVEYKHTPLIPGSSGVTEVVSYNRTTSSFKAYLRDTLGGIQCKEFLKNDFTNTAYFLALFPFLAEDEELSKAINRFEKGIFPSEEYRIANVLLICDNIYRRIEQELFAVAIPSTGSIWKLEVEDVVNGTYAPNEIIAGKFEIVSTNTKRTTANKLNTLKDVKALYWKEKELTEEEKLLVPHCYNDKTKVPPEVIELAEYITGTEKDAVPARNFMLRGITGYGKSTIAEMLAQVTNTPFVRITCHPTMETQDFLTKFIPDCNEYASYSELPTFEDIANDPETAYEMLTGKRIPEINCEACYKEALKAYAARTSTAPKYKLVESLYVKALSRGWIIEIQEPSMIMNSGVLTGLNEFDHIGSMIPMPDGSYRTRHKDAVVIYTDNVTYEGCRPLNQSVIRRNFMAFDLYKMSKQDILDRVKSNSGYTNTQVLNAMYKVWLNVQKFCQENAITDGSVSIVELTNWATAMRITGDFVNTCKRTVISKATAYIEEQEMLIASCLDTAAIPTGL